MIGRAGWSPGGLAVEAGGGRAPRGGRDVPGGGPALDLSGGFGIFKGSELERLFRDARLGRIHPGHEALTVEFAAKTALGIDPDETPRWG